MPSLSKESHKQTQECLRNIPLEYEDSRFEVAVEFSDCLPIGEVVNQIKDLPNPHVITWYIGYHGLRKAGVLYLRDFLISPVLKTHYEAIFWLFDLTAWAAFQNPLCSIHDFSKACKVLEEIPHGQIKCIKASKIFAKMQSVEDPVLIDYFNSALKRSFISKMSRSFSESHISIGGLFNYNCPIIADWYHCDSSKAYSILQYLEGCLLVEEIVMNQVLNKVGEVQVVFALPNNEMNYYKDDQNSFEQDIRFLIGRRCEELGVSHIRLNIKFLAFEYGERVSDRPYNAPGKAFRKGSICYNDIICL